MDIFSHLNDKQKEVAECIEGPLLVIAGAGTGKTHALTYRIANMIQHGIAPWQILAITFTNRAAKEIQERVENLLKSDKFDNSNNLGVPTIGTFHSVCVKILRSEINELGYEKDFVIYDTDDQKSAMKQVFKRLEIDDKQWTVKTVLNKISQLKNQFIGYKTFKSITENYQQDKLAEIYETYQKFLKENNALDFDDLIMLTIQLFEMFPKVLEKYQNRWKYISIDEYQDTNHAQYRFIRHLSEKSKNVCAIGDSDQSIYAFRGACITNILNFESEFKDAKVIKLEQNYRSTQTILDSANDLIKNNISRIEKNMWTNNGLGEKIKIWEVRNERVEAENIAKEIIKQQRENGISFKKNVVMYRTNAQSRIIEEVFLENAIPYKIIGGLKFYSRREIKDIIAYLRILINPNDVISLLRIINIPARKIGKTSINKVQNFALSRNLSFFEVLEHIEMVDNITSSAKNAFSNFLSLCKSLQEEKKKQTLSEFIDTVLEETGYKNMLGDGSIENITRLENIEELKSVTRRYDSLEDESLQIFLEDVALIEASDDIEENKETVFLMTSHSAKGLEFDNVFITGLEDGMFPHEMSMDDPSGIEEERRLMYVAMTRARKNLFISHANERMIFGKTSYCIPSRFLGEISESFCEVISYKQTFSKNLINEPAYNYSDSDYTYDEDSQMDECPEYEEGMTVQHSVFGEGKIIAISNGQLTISFGPGRVKNFMASIVPLKILRK